MAPSIPDKMQAIQVTEFHKPYQLATVPVPKDLGPHDLLIKTAVASNCHTDSMVQAGDFHSQLPLIGSHEGSGTVVATGSAVTDYAPGDRIMCGIPVHPCGSCADCTGPESQTQYCADAEGLVGVTADGCFAEYVRVDARTSARLPNEISFLSAAPMACAGRTVWRGVSQSGLEPGQWLAIVGSGGGLGHLGIQFAKSQGLKVIALDARDEGLALSREYGADIVLDARKPQEEVVAELQRATPHKGLADCTLCLSDAAPAAGLACAVTKMHGTMVQIAQPEKVSVPFAELVFRDVRIRGSLMASPGESEEMLRAVAEHGIKVRTNPFEGLEKIGELVEMVHGGKIQGKAVIVVDRAQLEHEKTLGAKC